MSVELMNEAINMCKAEEARLNETIQQYRDILRSMKMRLKGSETEESCSFNVKDDDIPLQEKQEIELLEQVLKKALKVRCSSAVTRDSGADGQKQHHAGLKGSCTTARKVSVNDVDERKPQKSSSCKVQESCHQYGASFKNIAVKGAVCKRPALVKRGASARLAAKGKRLPTTSASAQASGVDAQNKSCKSRSRDSVMEKVTLNPPSHEQRTSLLDKRELKTRRPMSCPKEQWVPSPLLPVWRAQRAKKDRMWNKVLSRHSIPVPERDLFKERLISTFPIDQPSTQAVVGASELDTLVQLGLDLAHCYHAELQGHQRFAACASGKDPEMSMEREYESLLMLEGLEGMMAKVIKHANYLKKEWERGNEPWWGPQCTLRWRGERAEPGRACLPPVLSYSSQAELEELAVLRLRVDQLRLEIRLHQAMSDTVSPCLMGRQPSTGSPSATVLRGAYSLLADEGTRFPALVLDSKRDQTKKDGFGPIVHSDQKPF
ncbi:tubulin epsilon and delta complex protein 2 [Electrophorus electricus]|uniref:tubulin epsilon and delta complex protein 2 n=1 Tax=Electrophorus electricus TaxID=8005 RepID=UPI0015D00A84|nr:tubulin epsilon and delta complex protein 2 [Electrophorus electricus]